MSESCWSDDSLRLIRERYAKPIPPRPVLAGQARVCAARRNGRLAERLVPVATELACLVHGDGGRDDIAAFLASVRPEHKDALLVVLAALVPVDEPVADLLAWVDFDHYGRPLAGPVKRRGPQMTVVPDRGERDERAA